MAPKISCSQPGVREKFSVGMPNLKNHSKPVYLGKNYVNRGKILIWGYAKGYNPDLGVCKHQKVGNT